MAEDTKQQIEQRIEELPENVRDAVLSAELTEHVRAIGQKHNLHIDKVGLLEDEVMLVMLGFFDPDKFNEQIEQELGTSAADAAAIAADVNSEIFMPIRESLIQFTEQKKAGASQSPTQQAIAQPATPPSVPAVQQVRPVPMTTKPPMPPAMQAQRPMPAPVPSPNPPAVTVAAPSTEEMLTQKTVTNPIYKADPYREPVE